MDKFIVFEYVYSDWYRVGTFDAMSDAIDYAEQRREADLAVLHIHVGVRPRDESRHELRVPESNGVRDLEKHRERVIKTLLGTCGGSRHSFRRQDNRRQFRGAG